MGKIKTFIRLLTTDKEALRVALSSCFGRTRLARLIPDKAYLNLQYRAYIGRPLNLNAPKAFNEKLQWLKLYDRKPEYITMVDKLAVKDYVSQRIGDEYIIPTLGTWQSADDIDFDKLPDLFVLKCNHDSGSVVICRDKNSFDFAKAKAKLQRKLNDNLFWFGREWPYKNVKPCIMAESYMADETQKNGLTDYKFYCFNGEPKFLYVSKGLEDHSTASISFLHMDWSMAPFCRPDFAPLEVPPEKPINYDKMVAYAKQLSAGIPFLRVDFYEIGGKLYFSELTFFPSSGFTPIVPAQWDKEIGSWLELPQKNNCS